MPSHSLSSSCLMSMCPPSHGSLHETFFLPLILWSLFSGWFLVCVCACLHVCTWILEMEHWLLKVDIQVVQSHHTWVLGIELRSSAKGVHALNCWGSPGHGLPFHGCCRSNSGIHSFTTIILKTELSLSVLMNSPWLLILLLDQIKRGWLLEFSLGWQPAPK